MVYARKRKVYGRPQGKRAMRKRMPAKSTALAVAQKALKLAKRTVSSVEETKYYNLNIDTDVAGSASFAGSAFSYNLSDLSNFNVCFGTDGVTGNKAYFNYVRGQYEIHCDNVNNEEETTNTTVVIVRPKRNWDVLQTPVSQWVVVQNGMPYFDPRKVQVLYKRTHTITMGGVQPGTAGESIAKGQFFIPMKRSIRFATQGATGQVQTYPADTQDFLYMLVFTDNSAIDTESPRMNGHLLACWRDADINHT